MTEMTLISVKVSQGKVSQGKSLFSGFAKIHVPFSEDDSLPCSGGQPRLWRQDQGREGLDISSAEAVSCQGPSGSLWRG